MKPDLYKEHKYLRAKERVEQLKKFYSELIWYVVIVGFLAWLNYRTNGWGYMWFLWVAVFWGIGVIGKGLTTFDMNPFMSKKWEERKLKEFMEEDSEELGSYKNWE